MLTANALPPTKTASAPMAPTADPSKPPAPIDRHGKLMTSHNTLYAYEPMQVTFQRIGTWLRRHPRNFVAVQVSPQGKMPVNEAAQNIVAALGTSGLLPLLTAPSNGPNTTLSPLVPDPSSRETMGQALASGKQAVVRLNAGVPQNAFGSTSLQNFGCVPNVFNYVNADIRTFNGFVSFGAPQTSYRFNPYLEAIYAECLPAWQEGLPNLIAVNEYETTTVLDIARRQNEDMIKQVQQGR